MHRHRGKYSTEQNVETKITPGEQFCLPPPQTAEKDYEDVYEKDGFETTEDPGTPVHAGVLECADDICCRTICIPGITCNFACLTTIAD